jgi:hypothetical protein
MDGRAEDQNVRATGKFSTLDWPTPEMLRAAHRARARALCAAILALGKWAKALMAAHPTSKPSRDRSIQPPAPVAHGFLGSSPSVKLYRALLQRFQPRLIFVQTRQFLVTRPKSVIAGASNPGHRGGERS